MTKTFRNIILLFSFFYALTVSSQQKVAIEKQNLSYTSHVSDSYALQQCVLDVYFPTDVKEFTTIIWYHGGGLTGGKREIPEYLKGKGFGIIGVGYRFSPQVNVEGIIQDAAEAVKWAYDHIDQYGGSKNKIVLSGHSAGGYLALMIGLNKSYLQKHDIDADSLMGLVPFSAQAITHFTKRQENQIAMNQPTIDAYAPLYWVRKEASPIVLITGDRELEMVGRYEENAYLARMLKIVGHTDTKLVELDGYDHGMVYPALPLLVKETHRLSAPQKDASTNH